MKLKQKQKNKLDLLSFLISKEVFINSLLVILIGIFLLPQFAYSSEINKNNIIELTNQERNKLGLEPLKNNNKLDMAALEKANYIFTSQKFQHNIDDTKFSDWIKKQDYEYTYVGENLAIDFISSEGVIDAWKKSPLHYKNLINADFKELGVAVINGTFENVYTTLVVQIFGTPAEELATRPSNQNSTFANNLEKNKIIISDNALQPIHDNKILSKLILLTAKDKNDNLNLDIDLNKLTLQKNNTADEYDIFFYVNRCFLMGPLYYYLLMLLSIISLGFCYSFTVSNLNKTKLYG